MDTDICVNCGAEIEDEDDIYECIECGIDGCANCIRHDLCAECEDIQEELEDSTEDDDGLI